MCRNMCRCKLELFNLPSSSIVRFCTGCWHELITLVMDSKEFHVPKRLASARLPYVKTYLGSAFAHEGLGMPRIELGIEAPAKALDSLLGIITGGRQYFEDWWDKNDYGGSLELIKVADFLGCTELVQIIEDLLIKELQVGGTRLNHVFFLRFWNIFR